MSKKTLMFEVYSKNGCPYCVKAKSLINEKNDTFKEIVVGEKATKSDIQNRLAKINITTEVRTVPQIIMVNDNKDVYIGGYDDLVKFYNN